MEYSRLIYCNAGQKIKISSIDGGIGAVENIKSLGIQLGDEIVLKSKVNGHGRIIIEHNGKEIALGYELASKILPECSEPPIITLDKVREGDVVEVTKMAAKGDVRFRLLDMGVVKGVKLTVIRKAPLGDPIEVLINGFNLSLRLEEARNIEVKLVELSKNNGRRKRWGMF